MAVALAAVSAVASVAQGFSERKAFRAEAKNLESQGVQAEREAAQEAGRRATEVRRFGKQQKLAFLKNSVTLEGSPLLILEETRREGQKEVDAITRRGRAQRNLFFERGRQARAAGRAAFLSGLSGGTTTLFNAFGNTASTAAAASG